VFDDERQRRVFQDVREVTGVIRVAVVHGVRLWRPQTRSVKRGSAGGMLRIT
jgi:hypothetical protein